MRGGYNDNPNVIYGTSSLRFQGSLALDPVGGNCRLGNCRLGNCRRGNCRRGRKRKEIPVENTPLPKRRRNLL